MAGITARCAADLVDVNRNTAAYYFQWLGDIVSNHVAPKAHEIFEGEIEVDESYFGGTRKGKREQGAVVKCLRLIKCLYLGYCR